MRKIALFSLLVSACTSAPRGAAQSAANNAANNPTRAAATDAVSPAHVSHNVSITVEPSDKGQVLIDAINAATTSVHVTMYLMTDYGVEDAIVAKAAAGLDVKVVLDSSIADGSTKPANTSAYNWFSTHGVNVVWSSSTFTFTHEKAILIDGTAAWILTMNTAHTSPLDNREYLALDTDADDIAEAEAIFQADYAQQPITPQGHLVVSPVNSHDKIVSLIYSAWTSVDLEVEELSTSDVVDALCVQQTIGVTTRVIIAGDSSNAQQHAVLDLENCGVTVVTLSTPYIHAKAIVVDGVRAYVGSVNFTDVSFEQNRELGLITNNVAAVTAVATQVAADIGAGTPVAPPPSCNTAADCANATDACDEGMCQEYCYGDECQSGYVCKADPGYSSGECVVQSTLTCTTTADCAAGLVCTSGVCSYCQSSSDCAADEWCLADGWCQSSFSN